MTKELKFEEKITKLEGIVNDLESGNSGLEESIQKYVEAMELVQECDKELKDVEDKIAKIVLENGKEEEFNIEN